MNPYQEIYSGYLRCRHRKSLDDVETLEGIAMILKIENLTLLQLRKKAYNETCNS